MRRYEALYCLMQATRPFSKDSEGGAHSNVYRFDEERLCERWAEFQGEPLSDAQKETIHTLASRYIVKQGKIDFFTMALTGAQPNQLSRSLLSWIFGPVGYNFMPTIEKMQLDVSEAMRLVPYFGSGGLKSFVAPDFLDLLLQDRCDEGEEETDVWDRYLSIFFDRFREDRSAIQILKDDAFFHAQLEDDEALKDYQRYVRQHPLTSAMEKRLADYFDSPISVGWRDVLRWFKGDRHPQMGWDAARKLIFQAMSAQKDENFLPREINYYSYDTHLSPEELQNLLDRNHRVARAFASWLLPQLPSASVASFEAVGGEQIAFDLLDFHCSYPLFNVEPYNGRLSMGTLRMLLRSALGLIYIQTGLREPKVYNRDLLRLPHYHAALYRWLYGLAPDLRERVLDRLTDALIESEHRDHWLHDGDRFECIPRTFYCIQELATAPGEGYQVKQVCTLEELYQHPDMLEQHSELAEKLIAFFVLVYRHFSDTGFLADLRPKNAGRDIFIYGIWGYMTENLLVIEEENAQGESRCRLSFVDNRDQFKEYRPEEDRQHSLGLAKYALHFVSPIIEPALLRAIGIFAEHIYTRQVGEMPRNGLAEHSLDLLRKLLKEAVDGAFSLAQNAVDSVIDDLHASALQMLHKKKATK